MTKAASPSTTPRPSAIIIPFAAAKAVRSVAPWDDPVFVDRVAQLVADMPSAILLSSAADVLSVRVHAPPALHMACVLQAFLCLARALDEAGCPVKLAEGRP